jgi:hypothetical protein
MNEYSKAAGGPMPPAPPEELRIDAPVWRLHDSVKTLINAADSLRQKMSPILQSEYPVPIKGSSVGEDVRGTHECPYGERILSSVDQVDTAINIINEINRRL